MSRFIEYDPYAELSRYERVSRGRGRKVVAGVALAAVVSPVFSPSVRSFGEDILTHKQAASSSHSLNHSAQPKQGLQACPDVAPNALRLAQQFVTHPKYLRTTLERQPISGPEIKEDYQAVLEANDTERYGEYEVAADKYGLTVHDVRPYVSVINADLSRPQGGNLQLSFETYLEQANQFLALYGVTVENAKMTDKYTDKNMYTPGSADLETNNAKMNLYSLMKTFAGYPEEYVRQLSGLKHIILVAGPKSKTAAYATMDHSHDTIHYNISFSEGPDIVKHEMNHLDDAVFCGGSVAAQHDVAYTKYNARDAKYGSKTLFTYEDIVSSGVRSTDDIAMIEMRTDPARCEMKHSIDMRNVSVSFIGDYAGKSQLEDKADTGRRIEDQYGLSDMTDVAMPWRVVKKYETQLGHLTEAYPALAYYFMAIQKSPSITPPVECLLPTL